MSKTTKFNYRKFYKEITRHDIPKDFDIHHIDFDRSNNVIENLVAIPRIVHQEYHKTLPYITESIKININANPMSYNYLLNSLNKHAICCEVIHYFLYLRDALIKGHNNSIFLHNYNTDFSYLINKL